MAEPLMLSIEQLYPWNFARRTQKHMEGSDHG